MRDCWVICETVGKRSTRVIGPFDREAAQFWYDRLQDEEYRERSIEQAEDIVSVLMNQERAKKP